MISDEEIDMTATLVKAIGLKPAEVKAVKKKLKDRGQSAPQYLRNLVKKDLAVTRTLNEILAPVREDFRRTGLSEEELEVAFERARNAVHKKPRRRAK